MQNIQTKDIAGTAFAERKSLGIRYHVEPWAINQIRGDYVWKRCLEKARSPSDLNLHPTNLPLSQVPLKKFFLVHPSQGRLLHPYATVAVQHLMRLMIR